MTEHSLSFFCLYIDIPIFMTGVTLSTVGLHDQYHVRFGWTVQSCQTMFITPSPKQSGSASWNGQYNTTTMTVCIMGN